MGTSKRPGDIYSRPRYLDLTFADFTGPECRFIEAACKKYVTLPVRRIFEPGCGGGRLLVELSRRRYEMVGCDDNRSTLAYARRRLSNRGLAAELYLADFATFTPPRKVDAAYCFVNTFRHLLTDETAAGHLKAVARSLRRGGVYLLGLHLLPRGVDDVAVERWSMSRGALRVTCTLRVTKRLQRGRLERVRLMLRATSPAGQERLASEFTLRRYTARQLRRVLARVPAFELCDVYSFGYNIGDPGKLNDRTADTVLVLRKR